MASVKHQDMPPSGGYQKIPFERIPAKKYFSGYQMILGYLGITVGAAYVYYLTCKKIRREEVEMRSARLALCPMLLAERDREFLKQLRYNRDEEAELMKNVKGWEVGTWYGDPVYKTLPPDTLVEPSYYEYYSHAPYRNFAERAHLKLWS